MALLKGKKFQRDAGMTGNGLFTGPQPGIDATGVLAAKVARDGAGLPRDLIALVSDARSPHTNRLVMARPAWDQDQPTGRSSGKE